jgi:hypothetical protein
MTLTLTLALTTREMMTEAWDDTEEDPEEVPKGHAPLEQTQVKEVPQEEVPQAAPAPALFGQSHLYVHLMQDVA